MKKFAALILLLTFCAGLSIETNAQGSSTMSENEKTVREFISQWSNLDAAELAAYFTEDGIYHNIPSSEIKGRENIERFITGFSRSWESTDWEIISLLADGDVVMVERLDKTVVAGSPVNLPCFGYFQLENGKIKIWRDYFDLATYTSALTAALENN